MLIALIKAMRPKQWAKNVLIFAAVVFDRKLTVIPAMTKTVIGAVIFSLIASVIYLINDLSDIEADRQHPTKRNRPIASGALPPWAAWTAVVVLLLVTFPAAYWLSPSFAFFSVNISNDPELAILVCQVNELKRKPCLVHSRAYIRSGPSAQRADSAEIRKMVLE